MVIGRVCAPLPVDRSPVYGYTTLVNGLHQGTINSLRVIGQNAPSGFHCDCMRVEFYARCVNVQRHHLMKLWSNRLKFIFGPPPSASAPILD